MRGYCLHSTQQARGETNNCVCASRASITIIRDTGCNEKTRALQRDGVAMSDERCYGPRGRACDYWWPRVSTRVWSPVSSARYDPSDLFVVDAPCRRPRRGRDSHSVVKNTREPSSARAREGAGIRRVGWKSDVLPEFLLKFHSRSKERRPSHSNSSDFPLIQSEFSARNRRVNIFVRNWRTKPAMYSTANGTNSL